MSVAAIALLVTLAGLGTPPRNARPPAGQGAEGAAGPAERLTDAEVADRVRTYLDAIDTPIPAASWRALGPRAVPTLETVVRGDEMPSRRARAVGALAVIGGASAQKLVLEVAHSEAEPFAVRTSALRGVGRLLPPRAVAKELRPVLERAGDPTVRAAAADVLARHAAPSACAAVKAQAVREERAVRRQFAPALERCGRR